MSIDQPRTPAGRPTGGEFSNHERTESDLDLAVDAASTLSPAALVQAAANSKQLNDGTPYFPYDGETHNYPGAIVRIDDELWFRGDDSGTWWNANHTGNLRGPVDFYTRDLLEGDVAHNARLDRPIRVGVNLVDRNAREIGLTVDELLAEDDDPQGFRPTVRHQNIPGPVAVGEHQAHLTYSAEALQHGRVVGHGRRLT
jgi:hypothetical protein